MKKITILLIALVLVCSSAFATFSLSQGFGYGGYYYSKKTHQFGPTAFLGVDFELANGLTFYDDVVANLFIEKKAKHLFLSDNSGVAYTFNMNHFAITTGAGISARFYDMTDIKNCESFYGINTRFKASLFFNKHWALSLLLNPSYDLMEVDSTGVASKYNLITGNALLGCTVKF